MCLHFCPPVLRPCVHACFRYRIRTGMQFIMYLVFMQFTRPGKQTSNMHIIMYVVVVQVACSVLGESCGMQIDRELCHVQWKRAYGAAIASCKFIVICDMCKNAKQNCMQRYKGKNYDMCNGRGHVVWRLRVANSL